MTFVVILSVVLAVVATVLDYESTVRALRVAGTEESNPVYGKRPGRLRLYGIGAGLLALALLCLGLARHYGQDAVTQCVVLWVLTGVHGFGCVVNFWRA